MGLIQKMSDTIKKEIRSWLNVMPAHPYAIQIQEVLDFELSAIRNRIWYRGDGNEIEQMYQQNPDYADKYKFWASKCTPGMEMRKIHTGLPGLMVRTLSSIVLSDMNDFAFENPKHQQLWAAIEKENQFREMLKKGLNDTLAIGDGAYKITIDTEVSQFPLLEWYPGERIEIIKNRGRLKEVVFKTPYAAGHQNYVLHEQYGYGYINSKLYRGEKEVPLTMLDTTSGIPPNVIFDKTLILAFPFQIFENRKYEGRGGSILDGKLDSFDAFDEVWSQWMEALRKGRAITYIPEELIPRDPHTGNMLKPNPFDNSFIKMRGGIAEDGSGVDVQQPAIPHESYLASYCTALDLCLQGVISPSTLGIDVKKLDNAEAQREKEKATLYTRDSIIEALQKCLPQLIAACINVCNLLNNQTLEEVKVDIPFGEYANPSFESQVETVGKGKIQGIMSIEAAVEELYGDSKDEKWKAAEVARLKAEQGIQELEEPGVNLEAGEFFVNMEGGSAGSNREKKLSDESEGVPGTSESGQ